MPKPSSIAKSFASRSSGVQVPSDWIERWIQSVAAGEATMSQRTVASIEKHGGIGAAVASARARGVHLVTLIDDKGKALVAASKYPFSSLC